MNYLHSAVQVEPGEAVLVELDHAANVKVMDDSTSPAIGVARPTGTSVGTPRSG